MNYIECAIEHYEDRVKSLDCRIWEEKLLIKLKELKNLEIIKNIAEDIIADDEWVKDSHTQAEHNGIKAGLYALIHHLEEVEDDN